MAFLLEVLESQAKGDFEIVIERSQNVFEPSSKDVENDYSSNTLRDDLNQRIRNLEAQN